MATTAPRLNAPILGLTLALAVALMSLLGTAASARAFTVSPADVFINEIHYDNDSTDANEAIEIAGPAGTDLSGWTLVRYNGVNGQSYNVRALSGVIPDLQNGFGALPFTYPVNGIRNGSPEGVALVNGDTLGQFLSYEGSFTAVGGPADGVASTDIGVTETGSEPPGQSLGLQGSGSKKLTDLIERMPAHESYTFIFEGNSQVLDHVLLSESLLDAAEDIDIAAFNANYGMLYEADISTAASSSDHNPPVEWLKRSKIKKR
jgi:hypothetical protein